MGSPYDWGLPVVGVFPVFGVLLMVGVYMIGGHGLAVGQKIF